jgi:hypothetical protein
MAKEDVREASLPRRCRWAGREILGPLESRGPAEAQQHPPLTSPHLFAPRPAGCRHSRRQRPRSRRLARYLVPAPELPEDAYLVDVRSRPWVATSQRRTHARMRKPSRRRRCKSHSKQQVSRRECGGSTDERQTSRGGRPVKRDPRTSVRLRSLQFQAREKAGGRTAVWGASCATADQPRLICGLASDGANPLPIVRAD